MSSLNQNQKQAKKVRFLGKILKNLSGFDLIFSNASDIKRKFLQRVRF